MKPLLWLGLRCSRRWMPHWHFDSASAKASLGWCWACGHPAGLRARVLGQERAPVALRALLMCQKRLPWVRWQQLWVSCLSPALCQCWQRESRFWLSFSVAAISSLHVALNVFGFSLVEVNWCINPVSQAHKQPGSQRKVAVPWRKSSYRVTACAPNQSWSQKCIVEQLWWPESLLRMGLEAGFPVLRWGALSPESLFDV